MTSVEVRSAAEVALELGMTIGAVHIARSRVRGRLRSAVQKFQVEGDSLIESKGK